MDRKINIIYIYDNIKNIYIYIIYNIILKIKRQKNIKKFISKSDNENSLIA